jgi:hypothetical protein
MIELLVIAALVVVRYYTHRRRRTFTEKSTQTEVPWMFYSELINIDDDSMSLVSSLSDLSDVSGVSIYSTHFKLELSDTET